MKKSLISLFILFIISITLFFFIKIKKRTIKEPIDNSNIDNSNYFQKDCYKGEEFFIFYDTLENINAIYSPEYMYLTADKGKSINDTLNRIFIEGIFNESNFSIYLDTMLIENKKITSTVNYQPVYVINVYESKGIRALNIVINNHHIKTLWKLSKYKYLRLVYINSTIHLIFSNKYPRYK